MVYAGFYLFLFFQLNEFSLLLRMELLVPPFHIVHSQQTICQFCRCIAVQIFTLETYSKAFQLKCMQKQTRHPSCVKGQSRQALLSPLHQKTHCQALNPYAKSLPHLSVCDIQAKLKSAMPKLSRFYLLKSMHFTKAVISFVF